VKIEKITLCQHDADLRHLKLLEEQGTSTTVRVFQCFCVKNFHAVKDFFVHTLPTRYHFAASQTPRRTRNEHHCVSFPVLLCGKFSLYEEFSHFSGVSLGTKTI